MSETLFCVVTCCAVCCCCYVRAWMFYMEWEREHLTDVFHAAAAAAAALMANSSCLSQLRVALYIISDVCMLPFIPLIIIIIIFIIIEYIYRVHFRRMQQMHLMLSFAVHAIIIKIMCALMGHLCVRCSIKICLIKSIFVPTMSNIGWFSQFLAPLREIN